jgi:hypothetical protein
MRNPKVTHRTSHEVETTTKQYMLVSPRSIGFDRIEGVEPVSMLEDLALTNRSPSSFVPSFSLPCRIASSEYLLFQVPPQVHLSVGALPTKGFSRYRGITKKRLLSVRVSSASLRSVLRLSQPLDDLLRFYALQAYFIPQPRVRFSRSGGSRSV